MAAENIEERIMKALEGILEVLVRIAEHFESSSAKK